MESHLAIDAIRAAVVAEYQRTKCRIVSVEIRWLDVSTHSVEGSDAGEFWTGEIVMRMAKGRGGR